jgi:hypothetical protein
MKKFANTTPPSSRPATFAPAAGLYHFDVIVSVNNLDKADMIQVELRNGGSDIQISMGNTGQQDMDVCATISTDVKLAANDLVTVWMTIPNGRVTVGQQTRTQFSGRRVY